MVHKEVHNDVHQDGDGGACGPAVRIDCTPRTGFSRQDLEVLDRWTPVTVAEDATASAGKVRRLRQIARTLYVSWLLPLRVRSEDRGVRLVFSHPAAGPTVIELCAEHTRHTDVWDACVRLRELASAETEK
ncbi:hypothetical protein [Streptomyces scopuliridis]|uniref:hypothetical protein n=1 Tax=Streptomyces scopuliridis TaxID=452529 RepID=UPI0036BF09E5